MSPKFYNVRLSISFEEIEALDSNDAMQKVMVSIPESLKKHVTGTSASTVTREKPEEKPEEETT